MTGLAALLARLLPGFASYFIVAFQTWHLAIFAGLVGFVLVFLDKILLVLTELGGLLFVFVARAVALVLIYLLNALPDTPDNLPVMGWAAITNTLGLANRYVPVDVAFNYLGVLLGVYGSILVWKLVRFIRGGA